MTNYHSLKDMMLDFRKLAKAAAPLVQPDWTERQTAALEAESAHLQDAVVKNLRLLRTADDPRWLKWYEQRAKAVYLEETLSMIRECGHWLACPTHGLGNAVETPPEAAHGLALHGLMVGGSTCDYERYCPDCGDCKREAQREYEVWKAMGDGEREPSVQPAAHP